MATRTPINRAVVTNARTLLTRPNLAAANTAKAAAVKSTAARVKANAAAEKAAKQLAALEQIKAQAYRNQQNALNAALAAEHEQANLVMQQQKAALARSAATEADEKLAKEWAFANADAANKMFAQSAKESATNDLALRIAKEKADSEAALTAQAYANESQQKLLIDLENKLKSAMQNKLNAANQLAEELVNKEMQILASTQQIAKEKEQSAQSRKEELEAEQQAAAYLAQLNAMKAANEAAANHHKEVNQAQLTMQQEQIRELERKHNSIVVGKDTAMDKIRRLQLDKLDELARAKAAQAAAASAKKLIKPNPDAKATANDKNGKSTTPKATTSNSKNNTASPLDKNSNIRVVWSSPVEPAPTPAPKPAPATTNNKNGGSQQTSGGKK